MTFDWFEIHGMQMCCIKNDGEYSQYTDGSYESEVVQFIGEHLGDWFVDIGAHCGWHGLHGCQGGAFAYFIEPTPECCREIAKALQVNGFQGSVINSFAWSRNEHVKVRKGSRGFTRLGGDRTVEARRVDYLAPISQPFGVKIDVEGAELNVIKGLAGVSQWIQFAVVELHPKQAGQDIAENVDKAMGKFGLRKVATMGPKDNLNVGYLRQ